MAQNEWRIEISSPRAQICSKKGHIDLKTLIICKIIQFYAPFWCNVIFIIERPVGSLILTAHSFLHNIGIMSKLYVTVVIISHSVNDRSVIGSSFVHTAFKPSFVNYDHFCSQLNPCNYEALLSKF